MSSCWTWPFQCICTRIYCFKVRKGLVTKTGTKCFALDDPHVWTIQLIFFVLLCVVLERGVSCICGKPSSEHLLSCHLAVVSWCFNKTWDDVFLPLCCLTFLTQVFKGECLFCLLGSKSGDASTEAPWIRHCSLTMLWCLVCADHISYGRPTCNISSLHLEVHWLPVVT